MKGSSSKKQKKVIQNHTAINEPKQPDNSAQLYGYPQNSEKKATVTQEQCLRIFQIDEQTTNKQYERKVKEKKGKNKQKEGKNKEKEGKNKEKEGENSGKKKGKSEKAVADRAMKSKTIRVIKKQQAKSKQEQFPSLYTKEESEYYTKLNKKLQQQYEKQKQLQLKNEQAKAIEKAKANVNTNVNFNVNVNVNTNFNKNANTNTNVNTNANTNANKPKKQQYSDDDHQNSQQDNDDYNNYDDGYYDDDYYENSQYQDQREDRDRDGNEDRGDSHRSYDDEDGSDYDQIKNKDHQSQHKNSSEISDSDSKSFSSQYKNESSIQSRNPYPITKSEINQLFRNKNIHHQKVYNKQQSEDYVLQQLQQMQQYGFDFRIQPHWNFQSESLSNYSKYTKKMKRKLYVRMKCQDCVDDDGRAKVWTSILGLGQINFMVDDLDKFLRDNPERLKPKMRIKEEVDSRRYPNCIRWNLQIYKMKCKQCLRWGEPYIFQSQLQAFAKSFCLIISQIVSDIEDENKKKHKDNRYKILEVHKHEQELCEACQRGQCYNIPKGEQGKSSQY